MIPEERTPYSSREEPEGPAELRGRVKRVVVEWTKTLLLVVILVLTIRAFVAEAYVVSGSSMENTLEDGERLLVTKFTPALGSLNRGDIIVFDDPAGSGKRLIKRIIGLPGETVEIRDGRVLINGEELNEPYINDAFRNIRDMEQVPVEEGHYFVLGDHRNVSNDSEEIGTIAFNLVVGRAIFLFYPLDKIQFF